MGYGKRNEDGTLSSRTHNAEGFVDLSFFEMDENGKEYICYLEVNVDGFYAKDTEAILESLKNDFKTLRVRILDSISWIHERIQSQTVLIQGGDALTQNYTVAESTEYCRYKQALRVLPSNTSDWTNIAYPEVPQCLYDDMDLNIKELCLNLGCQPTGI